MKYTKEIPTKPGWYWVRSGNVEFIEEWDFDGHGDLVSDSSFRKYLAEAFGPEYAGPIKRPMG